MENLDFDRAFGLMKILGVFLFLFGCVVWLSSCNSPIHVPHGSVAITPPFTVNHSDVLFSTFEGSSVQDLLTVTSSTDTFNNGLDQWNAALYTQCVDARHGHPRWYLDDNNALVAFVCYLDERST